MAWMRSSTLWKVPRRMRLIGKFAKPTLNEVEPRGTGGCKVQLESAVFFQPRFDFLVLVCAVVIQDQVEIQFTRELTV
jgi:hypothetical protein